MSTQDTCKTTSEIDKQYEETVLASDLGTVTFQIREDGKVWLGIRHGNHPHSPPEISIQLTKRQQLTLSGLFMDCRMIK